MPLEDDPQVQLWKRLLDDECERLRDVAAAIDPANVADVARLRAAWPADIVAAALELAAARRKAARKFDNAALIVADVSGVEQASSQLVAEHKAQRFQSLQADRVLDLCCGIGGDAMALARRVPVLGVDVNPLRAWMTGVNAGCDVLASRVEDVEPHADAFHIDPSRREESTGGASHRRWRFQDYQPGPQYLAHLMTRIATGAIKLGPGVEVSELPRLDASELEFISERGTLVQAVLWTGELALHRGLRTAMSLPESAQLTGSPSVEIPCVEDAKPLRYLHSINPAVERSELIGALCVQLGAMALHARVGLLTSDEPIESPWLTSFELLAEMPWREQRARAWLAAHDGGVIEVKTRGKAVDPDAVQKRLRGAGETPHTIFILRIDRKVRAFITRRLTSGT